MLRVLTFFACTTVFGQSVVDAVKAGPVAKYFSPQPNDKLLRCDVNSIPPRMSFGFRLQTGYVFRIPMSQYTGPGHEWDILARITPEAGGQPVYLGAGLRLPNVPKTNQTVEWGGFYWIGEGRYRVEWMLMDEAHRICRKQWNVDARLSQNERGLTGGMPAGAVAPVSFRRWSRQETDAAGTPVLRRLTVLLHAAPLFPRLTRFRAQDRLVLLGSLASLLEGLRAKSVRLVIFNLDQQRELFRRDDFTPEAFDQAVQSMDNVQLQLVNYEILQNRRGPVDLLAKLFNQEINAQDPSDAVVVLGPPTRYSDKVETALDARQGSPQFFYLQSKPYYGADFPDSIESTVKRLKGRKIVMHTPEEFAKAIKLVASQVAGSTANPQQK
jgi:hypothetical protein